MNDCAKELDVREAPQDWPYGIFPFRSEKPGTLPKAPMSYGALDRYAEVFPLNQKLTKWAFNVTRNEPLVYTDAMRSFAKDWHSYLETQRPPRVMIGNSFSTNHLWHGRNLTQWARDWVSMFTDEKARFVMSNTEDSTIAGAIVRLDRMGAVDGSRFMFLRAASNYTMPHDGEMAYQSLITPFPFSGHPGFRIRLQDRSEGRA